MRNPLTEAEIRALVGQRDPIQFLSPRNELFRQRNMKERPPDREEAIALMAQHPTLMRRPILVVGDEIVFGFDEAAYERLLAGQKETRAE